MKTKILTIFLLSITLLYGDASFQEKIEALDWKEEVKEYPLKEINAKITLKERESLLLNDDAKEFLYLSEGHRGFQSDAVILKKDEKGNYSEIIFEFSDIGYVEMNDWEENVNADEMLEDLKESTIEANKIRENDARSLFIDKWIEPPYLDRKNATIYWAIQGHNSDGDTFINAKSLKLGRKGYVDIIWVGDVDQFTNSKLVLSKALNSYSYEEGFDYKDYIPEVDKVAAVGAGALAFKLVTGKASAGLLALLLIFAKKLWFLIFLPFVFLKKRLSKLFNREKGNDID